MNRCPACGKVYADEARFCTRDGEQADRDAGVAAPRARRVAGRAERAAPSCTHAQSHRPRARRTLPHRPQGRRGRDVVRLSRQRHRDAGAVRDQGALGRAVERRERDGAAAARGEPRHAARASERLPHHPARRDAGRAGVRRDAVRRGRDPLRSEQPARHAADRRGRAPRARHRRRAARRARAQDRASRPQAGERDDLHAARTAASARW